MAIPAIKLRWLKPGDEAAVADIVKDAYAGALHYDYADADGYGYLAELDGVAIGFVLFWAGKPETWVRELAVRTEHRGSFVAARLMQAVGRFAKAHGSRAIAGCVSQDHLTTVYVRTGAAVQAKIVARLWLNDPKIQPFLATEPPAPAAAAPQAETTPAVAAQGNA